MAGIAMAALWCPNDASYRCTGILPACHCCLLTVAPRKSGVWMILRSRRRPVSVSAHRLRMGRFSLVMAMAGSGSGGVDGDGIPANQDSPTEAEMEKEKEEEWDEVRMKLNSSLQQSGNVEMNPVQALHEAARKFQLALENWGSLAKSSWFPTGLLGVDQNSWIKPFAYQAAVHAYLRAVLEIASCGEGRDRDTHILVQRSILRLCAPLEDSIKEQLLARDPQAEEWFWSKQHPTAVLGFVEMLKVDSRFKAVTSLGWEGASIIPSKASDITLITLAISTMAVLLKLGPLKLSCVSFSSSLTEEIERLMDAFAESVPIDQVYEFTAEAGLNREFLLHFGSRAVNWRNVNDIGGEESAFWVDLIQRILRRAIRRERLWSKLTDYESIEVLERDLSVFGFFAFLGRKTRSFLASKNAEDTHESLSTLLRYFTGGSVLFYPQLASLSTYQLFIEIVCEEMDWLPLYPGALVISAHASEGNSRSVFIPISVKREVISTSLDNCARWVEDFVKFSTWAQQTSGARAGHFLANCQSRLDDCLDVYCLPAQKSSSRNFPFLPKYFCHCLYYPVDPRSDLFSTLINSLVTVRFLLYELDFCREMMPREISDVSSYQNSQFPMPKDLNFGDRMFSSDGIVDCEETSDSPMMLGRDKMLENQVFQRTEQRLNLFDKELQNVDTALVRLETLLKEPEKHAGKEKVSAACSNLEKIRQLKREVEILEAVLQEKAMLFQQEKETTALPTKKRSKSAGIEVQRASKYNSISPSKRGDQNQNVTLPCFPQEEASIEVFAQSSQEDAEASSDIQNLDLLRTEVVDLERRIRECVGKSSKEHDTVCQDPMEGSEEAMSKESLDNNVLSKSFEKLKDATTDAWRGTKLLATDVAAATVLLKRAAAGERITDREKKILRRTVTDLASVIPIGFLMLLPVTAVGHAAILAAIQRYAPGLIPSTYGPERLELLKQLEEIKAIEKEERKHVMLHGSKED